MLNKDYLISDLTKKIVQEFGYKVKFHKNKKSIKKNYNSCCNIFLTQLRTGQKDHEELLTKNEKVFKDFDKTICTVEFPKMNKNLNVILNKITKSKNIYDLKFYLKKYFKRYQPQNNSIKVSKTI